MSTVKSNQKFIIKSDDVALPEVHTKEIPDTELSESESEKEIDIVYEPLAIPEIHIKKKK